MDISRIQCGIIGDEYVGKTTFCQTFKYKNMGYSKNYFPTIGVDFVSQQIKVDRIPYNITMWDLTGGERFRSIITTYFRSIKVALVCFSFDNIKSIKNLEYWINLIEEQTDDCYIVILGMKKDKINTLDYVGDNIINQIKKKYGYKLYEVENYRSSLVSSIMQEITKDAIFYNKFNSNFIKKTEFFQRKKKKYSNKFECFWCCW